MRFYLNLVAAAVMLAVTASSVRCQMTCTTNSGNPYIIRVEGTTEFVGDLELLCTEGTPTASGQPVPLVNITLTLNTNLTSRLIGGGYMDALLTIDEPYPSNPITINPGYPSTPPANSPAQTLCFSTTTAAPGSCNYLLGTGGGGYGTSTSPYLQLNASTMYAGHQNSANQVAFYGVPVDPPGNMGAERVIRITNIRANPSQLGLSSTLIPTQVVGILTTDASQMIFSTPQQTLAYIQQGLIAPDISLPLCGCPSHNASLLGGTGAAAFDASIQTREGFASALKRRNTGLTVNGPTPPAYYPQNIPGWGYFTESGFLPSPAAVSTPSYALTPSDSGTRLLLTIANVPAAVHVFLPVSITLANGTPGFGYPLGNTFRTPEIQLIQAQPNGFSGTAYTSLPSTSIIGTVAVAEASRIGTTLYATYEVVNSDPAALETANIPIALAYISQSNLSGSLVAKTSLAPLSNLGTAATNSEPIPRFVSSTVTTAPITGDFDSSGVPDRVWQNDTNSQVTVHYSDYASKTFEALNTLNTQNVPGWHVVAVADFNGDGIPDLVWQDDVTREVTVYYYGGAGGAVLQGWNWLVSSPVPGWRVVAAADFNDDGVPDLVWQNDITRQVTVYYYGGLNGAVFQTWNWLDYSGVPGWHLVGAGDFNRDGVPDLVWQNDTTRQVTIYYMGGTAGATIQSWGWLDTVGVPGWSVKSVSDVNGDGVPDLLLQNDTTHQVTVYYYGGPGGASLQSWDWISQPGVPGWSIVR